jgi:hypothetical protein
MISCRANLHRNTMARVTDSFQMEISLSAVIAMPQGKSIGRLTAAPLCVLDNGSYAIMCPRAGRDQSDVLSNRLPEFLMVSNVGQDIFAKLCV